MDTILYGKKWNSAARRAALFAVIMEVFYFNGVMGVSSAERKQG